MDNNDLELIIAYEMGKISITDLLIEIYVSGLCKGYEARVKIENYKLIGELDGKEN